MQFSAQLAFNMANVGSFWGLEDPLDLVGDGTIDGVPLEVLTNDQETNLGKRPYSELDDVWHQMEWIPSCITEPKGSCTDQDLLMKNYSLPGLSFWVVTELPYPLKGYQLISLLRICPLLSLS